MKITVSVGRCLKRKTVSVSKGVQKQNYATGTCLCNLRELHISFTEKHQNVNVGFSKFCALRPKWCVLVGSEMTHSVCICSVHQNIVLLVDSMDWGVT